MEFGGINYLAILVGAVLAFAWGAGWYILLSKQWLAAARVDPHGMRGSPLPFAFSFVALLIMGWVIAGVIGHLGAGQATLWNGIVSGFLLWLGFIATTHVVNHRFQGLGWDLTMIDAGHWLGACLILGAVIGWWG